MAKVFSMEAVGIERRQFVRRMYESFRAFTAGDTYRPKEWETSIPPGMTWEDLADDEHSWDGTGLADQRSSILEAWLDEEPADPGSSPG